MSLLVAAALAAALHTPTSPAHSHAAAHGAAPATARPHAAGELVGPGRFVTVPPAPWAAQDSADSLYRAARQSLNEQDYVRAADLFRSIVARYPKSQYAGDALYWRAYALYRNATGGGAQSDLDDAVDAIDRQGRDYPNAGTAQDARALRAQILSLQARRGDADAGQRVAASASSLGTSKGCPSDDDDERLIALQGLMQMDAGSAIPILKQVLARRGDCTERLRRSAVFILSQKRGDEATRMMLDVARNDPSPDVRAEAIQWLGQSHSELASAALDSILFSSADARIREKAVFALSQQRDPRAAAALRRFAGDDRMPIELRAQTVFWLGQRGDRDENAAFLKELFRKTDNRRLRESIVQAVGMSGAGGETWLLDVVRDKSFPIDVRKNALFWAAQHHGNDIAPIVALYDQMRPEPELAKQVLFVLSQRREPEATDELMAVASKDPDRELRKQAIFWLGQRKDPRVAQFLLDLINK